MLAGWGVSLECPRGLVLCRHSRTPAKTSSPWLEEVGLHLQHLFDGSDTRGIDAAGEVVLLHCRSMTLDLVQVGQLRSAQGHS